MASPRTTERKPEQASVLGNPAMRKFDERSYATGDQGVEPEPLTLRQVQVLRCVEQAIASSPTGLPPSRRELCAMLGITSQNAIAGHLRLLEAYGFLRVDPDVDRGIAVLIPSSEARLSNTRGRRSGLAKASGPGLAKARPRPVQADSDRGVG